MRMQIIIIIIITIANILRNIINENYNKLLNDWNRKKKSAVFLNKLQPINITLMRKLMGGV